MYPLNLELTKCTPVHCAFLNKILADHEPRNFSVAIQMPQWQKAMNEELQALDDNQTWSIVPLPRGHKLLRARWIYKLKYNSDGSLERHKARLIAREFTQTFGVDYKETFALVAKMNIVCVLLSIAENCGGPCHRWMSRMLFCKVR
ncbi:uncharacterized mitochondrial protein AtMg00820-like [Argentina anserina]|uniref:uncharacterized mitochondrial protein AtMg00820-like n=1 Tax=Argentina anserina TaxID=57926 RepID=UPI0021764DF4|nr:uncharacterized mitochondrial protein AtMg00820-like [Potentilla anserina]